MDITITLNTDNEAFIENCGSEVARILRKLAAELDERDCLPGENIKLQDANGNRVGEYNAE